MNVADRVVAVTLVVAATAVLIVTIVMSGSEGAMSIVAAIVAGTPGLLTWLQGNRTRDRVEAVHDKVNGGLTDRLHQQTDDIVTTLATRMAVNSESDRGNTSRRGRGGRVERSQQ
jgi:hypothetical protein